MAKRKGWYMGIMTVENKTRLIDVDDMQSLILNNLFSDETNKYFSNMDFKDGNCRMAFVQGMVYASILSAVKCERYIAEEND